MVATGKASVAIVSRGTRSFHQTTKEKQKRKDQGKKVVKTFAAHKLPTVYVCGSGRGGLSLDADDTARRLPLVEGVSKIYGRYETYVKIGNDLN